MPFTAERCIRKRSHPLHSLRYANDQNLASAKNQKEAPSDRGRGQEVHGRYGSPDYNDNFI